MNNKETIAQKLRKLVCLIEERELSHEGSYGYDVIDASITELWNALEEMGLSTRAINQHVGSILGSN